MSHQTSDTELREQIEFTQNKFGYGDMGYKKIMQLIEADKAAAVQAERSSGCPCTMIEPCSYACTCANQFMSGGCQMCCRYGSKEQRISAAKRLAQLQGGKDRK